MEIIKTLEGKTLTLALKGELNSSTSQELENVVSKSLKGVDNLIFDFVDLSYVSSAGLRILLVAKKIMDKQGTMIVRHVNKDVMDIFAKGSKLGLFNVVCIDRLNDMNHSREFDLDCFTHKIVQAVPRDEAFSLGVGQVINDVTPGLNVVYSNGVISDIFKPFIV